MICFSLDVALGYDDEYRSHILYYDKNRTAFKQDAVAAWKKLTELGCSGLAPE